jgi:PleD family two-component response regulator
MTQKETLDPTDQAPPRDNGASVLVVDDDESIRSLLTTVLRMAGYAVTSARTGADALERLAEDVPDVIVSDVMMPDMDGFALVEALRRDQATQRIPLIFLTALGEKSNVVEGLGLGADDYISKPFQVDELLARVRAKIDRPPVPRTDLPHDRRTGLLSSAAMDAEIEHELERARRSGRVGCLAYLEIYEGPRLLDRFGQRAVDGLARKLADLLRNSMEGLDLLGREDLYRFSILMPETTEESAEERLHGLAQALAGGSFATGGDAVQVTPVIGVAPFSSRTDQATLKRNVEATLAHAARDLNLRPVRYRPGMELGS